MIKYIITRIKFWIHQSKFYRESGLYLYPVPHKDVNNILFEKEKNIFMMSLNEYGKLDKVITFPRESIKKKGKLFNSVKENHLYYIKSDTIKGYDPKYSSMDISFVLKQKMDTELLFSGTIFNREFNVSMINELVYILSENNIINITKETENVEI